MKLLLIFGITTVLCSSALIAQDVYETTPMRIAQGVTTPEDWVDYKPALSNGGTDGRVAGITVRINTEDYNFETTPHYLVSLE
ncbi:hypothetical protein [Neolewinella antarctica]|uniref:Uncharacterized protein n=1 Tax=Neolewinella antarctica TaxID=442734 RepID=A0ABX0XBL0_9BACT|nr:hypothetical protein [Neolewinella antarctica]NJC26162.1 hypothetical protein [Neolewinella antarctica]